MKRIFLSLLACFALSANAAWPTGEHSSVIAWKLDNKVYLPDNTWCNSSPANGIFVRRVFIMWADPADNMMKSCIYWLYD